MGSRLSVPETSASSCILRWNVPTLKDSRTELRKAPAGAPHRAELFRTQRNDAVTNDIGSCDHHNHMKRNIRPAASPADIEAIPAANNESTLALSEVLLESGQY